MAKKHDIIWLESVDSTNEECRRRIYDIDNLSVVAALSQTSGKGQRGNTWISAPGENLTFSVMLKFPVNGRSGELEPIQAYDQFVLSEIAALTVVDLLAEHDIQAKIKWPNDIYVGEKKICGILIENSIQGEWIQHSIIGIGLNVNQRNFDVTLPNPTSMALCCESSGLSKHTTSHEARPSFEIREILEDYMDIFQAYLERYCHIRGGYGRLRTMYLSHLWRKDEPAQFIDSKTACKQTSQTSTPDTDFGINESVFTGIIRDLSDNGLLIVEMPDTSLKEFSFKEISYII